MGISLNWPSGLEWLAVIPLLSVLVFVHELGHFLAAIWMKVKVEEFGFGLPPRALVLFERKGVKYTINWLPLGGFVRMAGEEDGYEGPGSLPTKAPWQRFIVFAAGPAMNVLLAVVVYSIMYAGGVPEYIGPMAIEEVAAASPAEAAGLQVGDTVVRIGDHEINSFATVDEAVAANRGKDTEVEVTRDGQDLVVVLRPRLAEDTPTGEGAIGMTITMPEPVGMVYREVNPLEAVSLGVQRVLYLGSAMTEGLGQMMLSLVSPTVSSPEGGITGPVGIARLTAEVAQMGWEAFLDLGCFLSVNFALINGLPLPALDGGHIAFIVLEWLRKGKRVPPQKEALVHLAGMLVLIGLMLVVSYLDVVRWVQGGAVLPGG